MDKTKSSGAGKSSRAEQASAHSKDLVDQIDMRMVQNFLLIWLDNNIDDNSADCHNTITQLQCAVNSIYTFTNADQCVDFLTNIYNENACMIISGTMCQNIVPLIHNMTQLHTIFILCQDETAHEQWANDWFKIKGVFTEISPLCEALKQATQQCEQNATPISFMDTSDDLSKKNLDQLDSSFMYTQILKEILLTIKFDQKHMKEFIDYCREQFDGNSRELNNIEKLETKYRDETPIWWYTYECFLYPMLNRTLRLMDVDVIIKIGFFIGDLHRHIERLHFEQFGSQNSVKSLTVYRGQGMSKTDFEQITKIKGGLISFNNFLSTSKDRDVSLRFARRALSNPHMVGILFVMTTNPSQSTTPFASIIDVSYYKGKEDEVLFSMHTVFRIGQIEPMDDDHRLFRMELTLTSDNDKDLRVLTDRIREETGPNVEGWERLGLLLLKLGQSKKAQQVYEILLEQTTEESEKIPIYNQLGWAKDVQGEYKEAIAFFEKAFEIREKILAPNHLDFASSNNNIGNVYCDMGEYLKGLSYLEKALKIRQLSLPTNHLDLAVSYNNIGNVHHSMGEYSKALSSYEKALEIRRPTLPANHPDLAASYNNIGNVYCCMSDYSKAVLYHKSALEIRQLSLPPNHPDLASSYESIGNVYENMGEYPKALSSHEKALEIKQKTLAPNHPNLAASYNNIGIAYRQMGEYTKALSSY
jgi:tetratricopeptide (TPR) repeat protein